MAHQCAAISHTWCKNANRPWQNLVLPRPFFPCPICVLRRPRITKSSGSCSRARQRTCQKRPARLPAFSWAPAHNGRLSAQSRATANTATGKPRIPTGLLLIPPPRSAAAKGTMIRCIWFFYNIAHLQDLVNLFLASNRKRYRGSRGLPPSCRGAGMLPQASLLYLDDMDIRQLIVRLPGDDIGKQGDIRILQPLGGRGDGDIDAVVGHVSNAIGVALGNN